MDKETAALLRTSCFKLRLELTAPFDLDRPTVGFDDIQTANHVPSNEMLEDHAGQRPDIQRVHLDQDPWLADLLASWLSCVGTLRAGLAAANPNGQGLAARHGP